MIPAGTSRSDVPPEGIPADVWALARETYEQRPIRTEGIALAIMADRAGRLNVSGLTSRQAECLRAIQSHQAAHGVSPTVRNLMSVLGLASSSGVVRLLEGLEDRGAIRRLPNRSRAITIIANPSGA